MQWNLDNLPVPVLFSILDDLPDLDVIVSFMNLSERLRDVGRRWVTRRVIHDFLNERAAVSIIHLDNSGGTTCNAQCCNMNRTIILSPLRIPASSSQNAPSGRNDYELDHIAFFSLRLEFAGGYWDSAYDDVSGPDGPVTYNKARVVALQGRKMVLEATCAYHGPAAAREFFSPTIRFRLHWYMDPSFTPRGQWTLQWLGLNPNDLFAFNTSILMRI